MASVSMLPRELGGVVDNNLRVRFPLPTRAPASSYSQLLQVYGTQKLRVVDSSIVPLMISTHPLCMCHLLLPKMRAQH